MKYTFLFLISFCFLTTQIQTMNRFSEVNERPYSLTFTEQQKLKTIILDEYYNHNFTTQESTISNFVESLRAPDDEGNITATININTHVIAVVIQITSDIPENPCYKIVNTVTKLLSMEEFCKITDTEISNAGSLYR